MSLALTLSLFALAAGQQLPEDGRGQGLFTKEWHAGRRAALLDRFADKEPGVIVLRGAGTQDDYREFRQDNNFWYFTGVTTPNAVLVLVTQSRQEFLLVPPVAAVMETWVGDLIDAQEAREITGIEECLEIGPLGGPLGRGTRWTQFEELLSDLSTEYRTFYVQKQPAENWMMSRDNLQSATRDVMRDPYDGRLSREGQFAAKLEEKHGVQVKDITVLIDGMRVVKTPEEIEAMRGACRLSGLAHQAVIGSAQPGLYEWQLAAAMTSEMLAAGAMGPAYMAIVGSGPNATILHYSANNRAIQVGDVVMIDYGAEYNHFVADISRSWPVGQKFSKRQREIYLAVYDAQEAAFGECKPGSTLSRVHQAAERVLRKRGLHRYFIHGTSHWLGMATHDVGRYSTRFEPGMAFTVEPGVYIPDEGIGVRIEDVVVITQDGHELLSSMIPRHIDQIESLRANALAAAASN